MVLNLNGKVKNKNRLSSNYFIDTFNFCIMLSSASIELKLLYTSRRDNRRE